MHPLAPIREKKCKDIIDMIQPHQPHNMQSGASRYNKFYPDQVLEQEILDPEILPLQFLQLSLAAVTLGKRIT